MAKYNFRIGLFLEYSSPTPTLFPLECRISDVFSLFEIDLTQVLRCAGYVHDRLDCV